LLGENAGAGKLTRGWRAAIFLLRHGIGSEDHLFFSVANPGVERLTHSQFGLSQGGVADDCETQAQLNARDHFITVALKESFDTLELERTHEQKHTWLDAQDEVSSSGS
jgi:hypothetical protein